MRKNLLAILVSSALGLTVVNSQANILLSDSFSYANGAVSNVSGGKWVRHSGAKDDSVVSNGQLAVDQTKTDDVNSFLLGSPYTNGALYAAFKVTFTALPGTGSSYYFAHFKDAGLGTTFRTKIFSTNSASKVRLGLANAANAVSVFSTTDLDLNTQYKIVVRYSPATQQSALGINPTSEGDLAFVASDSTTFAGISTFAFRQTTSEGVMLIDDLIVATTYAEAAGELPGESPFFAAQPANSNVVQGANVTLSVTAGGTVLGYQWLKAGVNLSDTGNVSGALTPNLTLTGAQVADSGSYVCVISNAAAYGASLPATLTVSVPSIPPYIVTDLHDVTVTEGASTTLSLMVTGSPTLVYQWFLNNTNLPGVTTSNLTLSSITTNQAGPYFAIVSNLYGSATSLTANVTVKLSGPTATNIAYLHTLQDANYALTNTTDYFSVEGIVSTWQNLTGAAANNTNSLFYLQDDTGGVAVFWRGPSSPPEAGSRVRVVSKIEQYNGLMELAPRFSDPKSSVTVLSTENPLPAPLVFDYTWQNDVPTMEAKEGSLIVVSNVTFDPAYTTFQSVSAGITFTAPSGETFVIYINAYTDVVNQKIPEGTSTVIGVLGQFDTTSPYTSGYQIIPSRYADVISASKAPVVRFTNTLINLVRPGEALVSAYSDYGLRPGEWFHCGLVVSNSDGGPVTITPVTERMPSNLVWYVPATSGTVLSASFAFVATPDLAGQKIAVTLMTANTNVGANVVWNLYVPTADEQQVTISEFLANPTADTNAAHFNPLKRPMALDPGYLSNAYQWDEYVEIANLSGTQFDLYNWTISDAVKVRHTFNNGSFGFPPEVLPGHNAIIVYGGPKLLTNAPTLSVGTFPADSGTLALNDTGAETITLRNTDGNVISRVAYNGASAVGSLTRFPDPNSGFVPQAYTATNPVSPGVQFNGTTFAAAAPTLTNILSSKAVQGASKTVNVQWTAAAGTFYTLWQANEAAGPYAVWNGARATNNPATFLITNAIAPRSFFKITTP